MRHFSILSTLFLLAISVSATPRYQYSWKECEGSAMPYPSPVVDRLYPDSLTLVLMEHVGRHGARYPSSAERAVKLKSLIDSAKAQNTLTPVGKELEKIVDDVLSIADGRWGQLDSLGMREQQAIADRMVRNFPALFNGGVSAIASYVPRCVMSMYEFNHQVAWKERKINISCVSGPEFSPLLRPFSIDSAYLAYRDERPYKESYREYFDKTAPVAVTERVLGADFVSQEDKREVSSLIYQFLSGMNAMSYPVDMSRFMTLDECNALWSTRNLTQYLERVANRFSGVPSRIAAPLLKNIIESINSGVAQGDSAGCKVHLRFGHAETMMPLLSLMRIPGCYYMTDNLDSVADNWRNFYVVPMASNIQIIMFRSVSGNLYARVDFNECPVAPLPDSTDIYVPWDTLCRYWTSLLDAVSYSASE